VSLSLYIFTVFVHFRSLIENCVSMYLFFYGCISDTFILYYCIAEIPLYISLLYLCSHFVLKIIWITPVVDHFFQALKDYTFLTPILALPDFINTFVLEFDAFWKGIGIILMQYGRPLAFTRKTLSKIHLGQSIYEKEMLAILHVVDLWRPYLLGQLFKIKNDH
jgi:hypothetical protein